MSSTSNFPVVLMLKLYTSFSHTALTDITKLNWPRHVIESEGDGCDALRSVRYVSEMCQICTIVAIGMFTSQFYVL